MINRQFLSRKDEGFTLLEVLIYISILMIASVAVVFVFLSYNATLQELRVRIMLNDTAQGVLERVTREIRNADAVDPFNTTVDNPAGRLTLENIGGDNVSFAFNNDKIEIYTTTQPATALTPSEINVDEFIVYRYANTETELVRLFFTLTASTSETVITETFHSGAVLRGSYD